MVSSTVLVLGVFPPIFGRNIWQATALMRRSLASTCGVPGLAPIFCLGSFSLRAGWFRKAYLCGDNVKLEFFPVVEGLFECLNLESQRQITGLSGVTKEILEAYISLRPRPHTLSQPFETHL